MEKSYLYRIKVVFVSLNWDFSYNAQSTPRETHWGFMVVSSEASGSLPTIEQIDHRISMRLRQRRLMLGVTQGVVARALGVSFQQIQKYETGANRVSSSRLYELSLILDVPITYFYRQVRVSKNTRSRFNSDTMQMMRRAETLSLVRYYYMLDRQVRRSIASMCRSLAPQDLEKT